MIRAILTSGSMRSLRHKPDRSCAPKAGHISCQRQLAPGALERTDLGGGILAVVRLGNPCIAEEHGPVSHNPVANELTLAVGRAMPALLRKRSDTVGEIG